MKIDDETALAAVRTVIAERILKEIDTEARDAILAKSIENSISDWSFKNALEKTVAAKATEAAEKLLATREWQSNIRQAVEEGLALLVERLPEAIALSCREALAGSGENYGPRSLLLKHLDIKKEDDK